VTWMSITAGSAGTGNGTVSYSAATNTSTSARTGTLTIAGKTYTVTQAGTPSGIPDISVYPASINFGNVTVRKTSTQKITVSNTGTGTLNVSSMTITSSYTDFKGSHNCTPVAPNGTCTVTLTFTPASTGSKSATLKINSNDPDENPVSITLRGNGS
jgi:hypothetical protein